MQLELIRGRLAYTSKKPQLLDRTRGGELFLITKYRNGGRTFSAHCWIDEDPPRVVRDVVTNLDAQWNPTESFVQIAVDSEFVGSCWYRFTANKAEAEGFNRKDGRIQRQIPLEAPLRVFGTHPIQADAIHTQRFDLSQGTGEQTLPYLLMCSLHHRGADGPDLFEHPDLRIAYLGTEQITVIAGSFQALHFRIGPDRDPSYMGREGHPPYHMWVTADGDYITLKAHVAGYMQTYYELVSLHRERFDQSP